MSNASAPRSAVVRSDLARRETAATDFACSWQEPCQRSRSVTSSLSIMLVLLGAQNLKRLGSQSESAGI
jgi:hypothetical protein